MNTPIKTSSKIKAFMFGAMIGLLAYLVYSYLGSLNKFSIEAFDGLGWIFFASQYPVYWMATALDLPNGITFIISLTVITLSYGYIFLSFRLHQGLAIGAFLAGSSLVFIFMMSTELQNAFSGSLEMVPTALLWPALIMSDVTHDLNFSGGFIRIVIECFSVGFWYATLFSGIRTFFLLIKGPVNSPDLNAQPPTHLR
jgi:hypothetical protein